MNFKLSLMQYISFNKPNPRRHVVYPHNTPKVIFELNLNIIVTLGQMQSYKTLTYNFKCCPPKYSIVQVKVGSQILKLIETLIFSGSSPNAKLQTTTSWITVNKAKKGKMRREKKSKYISRKYVSYSYLIVISTHLIIKLHINICIV